MTVTGTDDMGAYIDTGVAVLPTQRPATDIDYSVLAGVTVADPGRADHTLKVPAPARTATQRR